MVAINLMKKLSKTAERFLIISEGIATINKFSNTINQELVKSIINMSEEAENKKKIQAFLVVEVP